MGQSVRQVARKKAQEAADAKRRERLASVKRRESLGLDVLTALAERDESTLRCERTAGAALSKLMDVEGVSAGDIEEWVPGVSAGEVRRLRALAVTESAASDQPVSDPALTDQAEQTISDDAPAQEYVG